jgi:hypothetical protein
MMRYFFWSFCCLFILCGCNYEIARPPKVQHLHIASDVLRAKDSVYFTSLKKFKKIDVHIHHMTVDSLVHYLQTEGLNAYIDVVILSSIEDGDRLEKNGLLQRIHQMERIPTNLRQHVSASNQLVGIGFNPYVFVQERRDSLLLNEYTDINTGIVWQRCGNNALIPFVASIQSALKDQRKLRASKWVTGFLQQESRKNEVDSLRINKPYFGRYSDCADCMTRSSIVRFPNQQRSGVYADMTVLGIVRQARNYSSALEFLSTLELTAFIKQLNEPFGTFVSADNTMQYNGTTIKLYPVSPLKMKENYTSSRQLVRNAKKKNKKANL